MSLNEFIGKSETMEDIFQKAKNENWTITAGVIEVESAEVLEARKEFAIVRNRKPEYLEDTNMNAFVLPYGSSNGYGFHKKDPHW
ncbi:hypothetical protein H6503_01115 [Candidatus Woesearchaeota archaeon]|nr:hypothetical protein [Candidatus Woesearchaeota archaeon]